jgi:hypothetical protein
MLFKPCPPSLAAANVERRQYGGHRGPILRTKSRAYGS